MKIRGTPAHIAEKYLSLARDAQSSGDPVLAENYLQHAEHYSRIIMAYRDQMHQSGEGYNGNGQRLRGPNEGGEGGDEFGDEEGDDLLDDAFSQPPFAPPHQQAHPQSRPHGGYDNNRHDRPFRRDRDRDHGRFRDRDRHGDRDRGDRPQFENRPQAPTEPPAPPAEVATGPVEPQQPRRRERFQPQQAHEQPEFLRRPVRRARTDEEAPEPSAPKEEPRD